MGLRSRLKSKVKGAIEGVSALAKVIHDEANHPGRPQPHMAARNPLWGGGEVDRTDKEETEKSESSAVVTDDGSQTEVGQAQTPSVETEEVDYWFLNDEDGEGDDWSQTNPKG